MAGPGRVVKKKRGGGRPRSLQAAGVVEDEPPPLPPATAEQAEKYCGIDHGELCAQATKCCVHV